ncbi:MAG: nickel-dependent lactate racemase [Spirochaetia bacterium]|nr:nickel-dependent lactate racemase [Spirochaetia bacterium]
MRRTITCALADQAEFEIPDTVDVLSMPSSTRLPDPEQAIQHALDAPIASRTIEQIIAEREEGPASLTVCIVVSDNTRPVPYTGASGILWPVVERVLNCGVPGKQIQVIVATGTHRGLTDLEMRTMFDPRVREHGVTIINHDCLDEAQLVNIGRTSRGSEIIINRTYMESDIRILTGLVESHFMAGASGGRKSVCPGLIGEQSTFIFHGYPMLAHPNATTLILKDNPCHLESLEMAHAAGVDFIINVTLDHEFACTGVFAGDLEAAHEAAVAFLSSYSRYAVDQQYDIVITHGGFVGINHYQTAKAAVEAAKLRKDDGYIILLADNTDTDVIGSLYYRTTIQLLKLIGPQAFNRLIQSDDWTFIPEQWQVQEWTRVFDRMPMDHLRYYSPQFGPHEYAMTPGSPLLPGDGSQSAGTFAEALELGLAAVAQEIGKPLEGLSIAFIQDGPYGVPSLDPQTCRASVSSPGLV